MLLVIVIAAGFVVSGIAPLVSALAGKRAGWVLAVLPVAIAAYFLAHSGGIADGDPLTASYAWVPGLDVRFSLHVDGLALFFALLITIVGAIVIVYSGAYLAGDPRIGRFYAYIILFMASMTGLVVADNVLTLYVFWELTSISSFLLIGFDHHRESARRAALQALLVTTGGGLAMLGGLVLLGIAGGSFELSTLLGEAGDDVVRDHALYAPILILIAVGAFTKSAQFPFHFWLPNAMEAPAPVSAYLHSATMVKAGIYLLARLFPILGGTLMWESLLISAGVITTVTGAYFAITNREMKRVLAYSTVSVLGLIVLMLALDTPEATNAAIVFILAHALYKGTLFLVAGSIDHETGERNLLQLGGLRRAMPITAIAGGLAAISMAGLPPFFGFIGKELLLESALHVANAAALAAIVIFTSAFFVAVAIMTGITPFFGSTLPTPKKPHEAPPAMWLGPILLASLGLVFGLAPIPAQEFLLEPAVTSVRGVPADLNLALWHGFNLALGLSVATWVAGLALFGLRRQLHLSAVHLRGVFAWGPQRWYDLLIEGINVVARGQTRILQNGYLRYYLQTIIAATVVLVGFTLIDRGGLESPPGIGDATFYELTLAALIVMAAIAAITLRSRLAAAAALGVVGYGVALIFILFGAPDLAMTQFLVETLTVVLFVLVFYHMPQFASLSSTATRIRDAVLSLTAGALITALVITTNGRASDRPLTSFFAEASQPLGHGRNIVNVILVDFRALDTLGEITVLAIAAIGVFALLKLRPRKGTER